MIVKVQGSSHGLSDHADTSQGYRAWAMVARGTGSFSRQTMGTTRHTTRRRSHPPHTPHRPGRAQCRGASASGRRGNGKQVASVAPTLLAGRGAKQEALSQQMKL